MRTELNIETGEIRQVKTTAYCVDGAYVLIDDGQPVPQGAVLASTVPVAPTVPQIVTRRQAMLALLAAGKLDTVELQIQNSPRAVQIAWEAAGTFERANPLIKALAPSLGLSDEDIDNLFIEAAKL
jgi:hypothetical protein